MTQNILRFNSWQSNYQLFYWEEPNKQISLRCCRSHQCLQDYRPFSFNVLVPNRENSVIISSLQWNLPDMNRLKLFKQAFNRDKENFTTSTFFLFTKSQTKKNYAHEMEKHYTTFMSKRINTSFFACTTLRLGGVVFIRHALKVGWRWSWRLIFLVSTLTVVGLGKIHISF